MGYSPLAPPNGRRSYPPAKVAPWRRRRERDHARRTQVAIDLGIWEPRRGAERKVPEGPGAVSPTTWPAGSGDARSRGPIQHRAGVLTESWGMNVAVPEVGAPLSIPASHPTLDRVDYIVADDDNGYIVCAGVASVIPTWAVAPPGRVVAKVHVRAGTTTITPADVKVYRPQVPRLDPPARETVRK